MPPYDYEFYRKRKHDPKWRVFYLKLRNKKILKRTIVYIILVILLIVLGLFINYIDEYKISLRDFNLKSLKNFFNHYIELSKKLFWTVIDKISHTLQRKWQ